MRLKSENTRQVLFAAAPMVFFGILSFQLFSSGHAEYFSRLGSLILVWAIINLSFRREEFATALFEAERNRLVAHNNRLVEKLDLMQQSLHRTFNLHAAQIAKLSQIVYTPNPFIEDDPSKIDAFYEEVCASINDTEWQKIALDNHQSNEKIEREYNDARSRLSGWNRFIFKAEMLLIIWGTIQWGYGDLFVEALHPLYQNHFLG